MIFGVNPGKSAILKLKGLKDLEVVLAPMIRQEKDAQSYLVELQFTLPNFAGMIALKALQLRSLRVTMEAQFVRENDDHDMFPTFTDRGEVEEIERWLKRFELELHVGSSVAAGHEPMPPFAVRQNDDAIRIPPWSTDEALERVRVEREERCETYQLENEHFEAT